MSETTTSTSARTKEIKAKLERVRALMDQEGLSGVHLRGVDWFAWATGGGSSSVIMTNEIGVGEVLITKNGAWVMTPLIEHPRLREEEVPSELEVAVFPWQETRAIENFVREKSSHGANQRRVASDRPLPGQVPLPRSIAYLKRVMVSEEIERYRAMGRLAAEAMTEALSRAESSWTETELAGEGARACWSRGLEPTLVLVAGAERGVRHRHPIAKPVKLGRSAMMVFCARAYGLYANLTRFVYFEEPSSETRERFSNLAKVESAGLDATKPGARVGDVYTSLKNAYAAIGQPNEINLHHQGGPSGYLSRELVAGPDTPDTEHVELHVPFAWNPSLPGAKIEDTVLVNHQGVEILTVDPKWPTMTIDGRKRPDLLIRN